MRLDPVIYTSVFVYICLFEDGFVRLDQDVQTFKLQQEEAYVKVRQALEAQENRTTAQNTVSWNG